MDAFQALPEQNSPSLLLTSHVHMSATMLPVCREFKKYGIGMGPNTIMLSEIWQISSEDKMKDIHSVVTSHLFK
jgi:hypothetical protein